MPQSKTDRVALGCLAGLLLLCILAIPVGFITLRLLDDQVGDVFENTVATLEGEQTQSAIQTKQKANENVLNMLTQTATVRQTTTPAP